MAADQSGKVCHWVPGVLTQSAWMVKAELPGTDIG